MWNKKIIKVMPAILFLFCLLGIFELVLIVDDLNKTERLEAKIKNNLKVLEHITILLDERLKCMDLEHPKDRKK
ncbi:hypothetical protein JP0154_09750 [Helicobacter pylori]